MIIFNLFIFLFVILFLFFIFFVLDYCCSVHFLCYIVHFIVFYCTAYCIGNRIMLFCVLYIPWTIKHTRLHNVLTQLFFDQFSQPYVLQLEWASFLISMYYFFFTPFFPFFSPFFPHFLTLFSGPHGRLRSQYQYVPIRTYESEGVCGVQCAQCHSVGQF